MHAALPLLRLAAPPEPGAPGSEHGAPGGEHGAPGSNGDSPAAQVSPPPEAEAAAEWGCRAAPSFAFDGGTPEAEAEALQAALPSLCQRLAAALSQQAVEKIDRVREL